MINFEDKEDLREVNLPRKNTITAADLNEIKEVVNRNSVYVTEVDVTTSQLSGINQSNSDITLLTAPTGKLILPVEIIVEKRGNAGQNITDTFCNIVTIYKSDVVASFANPGSTENMIWAMNLSTLNDVFYQIVSSLTLSFVDISTSNNLDAGNLNLKFIIKYKLFNEI